MALLHFVSTLLCLSGTIWWSWIFAYLNQKTNGINFDISKMNICAAFMGYFFNAWIFSIIFLEFLPFNPILANLASFVITFSSVYIFTSVNICNFHLLLYVYKENWATQFDEVIYFSILISFSELAFDKFLSFFIFTLPDPVFPILAQNGQTGFLQYGIFNWSANICLIFTSIFHAYLKITKGENLEEKKAYKILTLIIASISVLFCILVYFFIAMDLLEDFLILCFVSITFTCGTLLPISIILPHENLKKYVFEKTKNTFAPLNDFVRRIQLIENQTYPLEV